MTQLYYLFKKIKMAPVRHLVFSKILFLSNVYLGLPIFHHCTKIGAKTLIDARIMAQNRNPRWRPSAILELLHHHIGPPTKSLRWSTSAVKFYANPSHSFEDMAI